MNYGKFIYSLIFVLISSAQSFAYEYQFDLSGGGLISLTGSCRGV